MSTQRGYRFDFYIGTLSSACAESIDPAKLLEEGIRTIAEGNQGRQQIEIGTKQINKANQPLGVIGMHGELSQ